MSVVLTVRDVPEEVRDSLATEAQHQGKSLQGYLVAVLERQARFVRNRLILAELESELGEGGGAGPDAPDAADLIREARPGGEGTRMETGEGGAA